ncbi:GNAT family N-acetyltransferase [Muribaculum sp.]|uniref:GNAT family N-acetyltransferase n=1 Tax=Muribaculum sp. TaxID=1918611 RepID=UPI0023C69CDB|nr:GNAT family N-acetyltransferase [Muribaculum sp.]MDE5705574.1 GNAT family N-acetyltransferase [Muribaculum sp.]
MTISIVNECDKERYMALLLVGDESEPMIRRYLDRSELYAGCIDNRVVAVCAVTCEGDGRYEVKNLAVEAGFRRKGIGRAMLEYVETLHPGSVILLGTGESPSTLGFYHRCGYVYSYRIPGFFTNNYPEPIVEDGVTLRDMVYLSKHT